RRILAAEAQLLPHPLVPEFRQRLGRLDAEAVEIKIVLILIFGPEFFRQLRRKVADGDQLQPDHVELPRLDRAEKVADAKTTTTLLAWELESRQLAQLLSPLPLGEG